MQIKSLILGSCLSVVSCLALAAPTTPNANSMNATSMSAQKSFTPEQVKDLHAIIHDYLINHPDVLVEASQALQAREIAKSQEQSMASINNHKDKIFNDPHSPTAGNASGNTVLVEFFDYQCGHCKDMNSIVHTILSKNKNLKIIYKELPIFGGDSTFAAKAALASVAQGKFEAFHNALMAAPNPLNKDKILAIARQQGIDISQLTKDMQSPAITQQIRDTFALAQKLKLMGTPAFVVGNQSLSKFNFIPGATSQQDLEKSIAEVNGGNAS